MRWRSEAENLRSGMERSGEHLAMKHVHGVKAEVERDAKTEKSTSRRLRDTKLLWI